MKVLIIDNYDSFTYNLYQFIGEILSADKDTFELIVKRNDEISLADVEALQADRIIISPGPGSPDDEAYFGVCADVIKQVGQTTPVLGVCLGMQGIVHAFGGDIIKAVLPMHGKLSPIVHNGQGLYRDIPQSLEIMRYHSLIARNDSLPECLEVTAYIDQGQVFEAKLVAGRELMGIRHKTYPIVGIQFHPESFASEGGKEMIAHFLHGESE